MTHNYLCLPHFFAAPRKRAGRAGKFRRLSAMNTRMSSPKPMALAMWILSGVMTCGFIRGLLSEQLAGAHGQRGAENSRLCWLTAITAPIGMYRQLSGPFFSHVTDREKKYSEWQTPFSWWNLRMAKVKYPAYLAVFSASPTMRIWRRLVSCGRLYKYNRVHSDPLDRTAHAEFILPFSDYDQKNTETGAYQRREDLWPLFTYRHDYNGNLLPDVRAAGTDAADGKSPWNGITHRYGRCGARKTTQRTGAKASRCSGTFTAAQVTPESKKCSLLFGLFQYQSGTGGKHVRLFYIPVMATKPIAAKSEAK